MKKMMMVMVWVLWLAGVGPALAALQDAPECKGKDHPLFSRMPHFFLSHHTSCQENQFGDYRFHVNEKEQVAVEGKQYLFTYNFDRDSGRPLPSALQLVRNYTNAIERIGGKVLASFDDGYRTTFMRVSKDNKEIWAKVGVPAQDMIELVIVEREEMKQEVVANAETLASDLETTGKVAVYGIYFDSGKAEVKPESEAALVEIAKLLVQEQGIKVYIVGHTDNVGNFDANLKLSRARAEAVVKALVARHKIEPGRLQAHGVSSLAPVAANGSEEGRAKNRRVELVVQ